MSADLPSVLDDRTRTAGRDHVCGECGCAIAKGSRYRDVRGLWDGEWSRHKQCLECAQAMQIAMDACDNWTISNGEGPWYGGVWEWWREHMDYDGGEPPAEIAAMRGWRAEGSGR